MDKTEATGIIGKTAEAGMPVIWSFVSELPSQDEREGLSWLIILAWHYDGSERNGMPPEQVNQKMLALEDALEELEVPGEHVSVYRRTGNGLKEFAYYARDNEAFMQSLNSALASHERYPIEISFYEDAKWSDFSRLLADFGSAQQCVAADRAKPRSG